MLQKFWQLFIICFSILIYVLEKGELDWYISKGTSITLQFFHFKHCSVFFYFYYSTLSEEMQLYYIMIFIILYVNLPLFPLFNLRILFLYHIFIPLHLIIRLLIAISFPRVNLVSWIRAWLIGRRGASRIDEVLRLSCPWTRPHNGVALLTARCKDPKSR